jgi:hypothetical protein
LIKQIPAGHQIALEARTEAGGSGIEIAIYDLTQHTEAKWDVVGSAFCEHIEAAKPWADWAPTARQFFFATGESAHLVNLDGSAASLTPRMPGHLDALNGMSSYAVSADAKQIAYLLYVRDIGERQADGFGKLYADVMYQQSRGSPPTSIAHESGFVPVPSWRPDGAALAYVDRQNNVVVSTLQGKALWSVHPGPPRNEGHFTDDFVTRIRWDPSGRRLAMLWGVALTHLSVVNADGTGIHEVVFRSGLRAAQELRVRSFGWSPDGNEFLLHAEAGTKCNYDALGYKFETGTFPCIGSRELYRSRADGSALTKVSPFLDYSFGDLFWIQ